MRVWRILALPSCNRIGGASWRNRSKLAGLCVVASLSTSLLAYPLVAQANGAAAPPAQHAHPTHRRANLDDRVKTLAAALKLDEAQQVAVKKIVEQWQQETLQLRRDTSIAGSVRIERLRAIQDKTVERIRTVLTDEQKKKYDPLAVRRVAPAPEQKSVEDWLKVTSPQ